MIYIVMGVSGCGKSTLGAALAERLGLAFYDGDDFHPQANKQKMAAGDALDDSDRQPWLESLADHMTQWNAAGGAVLACSALKQSYRDTLTRHADAMFIYLEGSQERIANRLASRSGHFFAPALLDSQFADLEPPQGAITVSIDQITDDQIDTALRGIKKQRGRESFSQDRCTATQIKTPDPFVCVGDAETVIDRTQLESHLDTLIDRLITKPNVKRLLIIPPDITRLNSRAGDITAYLWDQLHNTVHIDILPALGTHTPMTPAQCEKLFGPSVPFDRIIAHDWRNDLKTLGEVSAVRMSELSDGRFAQPMQIAVNKRLIEGGYDLILSIGQVVPHEVIGMANYTKNILIGVGGKDTIDKSHFLGAACGMETIMGQTDTPVRQALNGAFDQFVRGKLPAPIHFILTVIGDSADGLVMRGLFAGEGDATFEQAAALSKQINFDVLDQPIKRCVIYLDPDEFHSTWLGNKAIYRTRMAMADQGELIILAPAVGTFGEDAQINQLIRKHGYCGTPGTLQALEHDSVLAANLSAAAHLIHGSTEGRFTVTYCTTDALPREAIESVGYAHRSYDDAATQYPPQTLTAGWHTDTDGEPFFYIPNPALGLWAARDRV